MATDFSAIYPEIVLILFAVALPAVHLFAKSSKALSAITLVGLAASMGTVFYFMAVGYPPILGGLNTQLVQLNELSALFMLVFLVVSFFVVLASTRYVEMDRHLAEYYSLILLSTAGMMLVASSLDLITLFVGLELASISSFALVAFRKKDKRGAEAAAKYFVIGGLSSALALYGISLLYGVTGTTNFQAINAALAAQGGLTVITLVAIAMLIAGFGFKVAIVPFHMWAPDVYEGAPTTISSMLAAGSKKMGLVALFKIFLIGLIAIRADWSVVVGIIAIVTMTVGNLLALSQTNIKRMLAYSSIAQAGYILIAIPIATQYAVEGALFQIITHAFMKGGAFIIVAALSYVALGESLSDYKGLAKRAPFIAFSLTILLFSLAGIPPLAGFASKFVLFSGPVYASAAPGETWLIWLAVAGVLNSALSLYYYVRVIKYMYVDKGDTTEKIKLPTTFTVAIAICMVAVIVIGLWPEPVLNLCAQASSALNGALPLR